MPPKNERRRNNPTQRASPRLVSANPPSAVREPTEIDEQMAQDAERDAESDELDGEGRAGEGREGDNTPRRRPASEDDGEGHNDSPRPVSGRKTIARNLPDMNNAKERWIVRSKNTDGPAQAASAKAVLGLLSRAIMAAN